MALFITIDQLLSKKVSWLKLMVYQRFVYVTDIERFTFKLLVNTTNYLTNV